MISDILQRYIQNACVYAKSTFWSSTTLVHILLTILDDESFQQFLRDSGIDYLDVRQETVEALADRLQKQPLEEPGNDGDNLSSLSIFALANAYEKAKAVGLETVGVLDLVAAILEIHDNGQFDYQARTILSQAGLTGTMLAKARRGARPGTQRQPTGPGMRPQAADGQPPRERIDPTLGAPRGIRFIAHGMDSAEAHEAIQKVFGQRPPEQRGDALARFCTDLTQAARDGKLDRSYGREDVLFQLEMVLSRRKKSNAILVGEPGVGKTSVIEELAWRVVENRVSPRLAGTTILSLNLGALVGGTRYRGDLEERLAGMIAELKADQSKILFVDEIHTLVSPTHSAAVAADLLKPALASGELRCVGATTHAEYKRYFESDGAMSRRFVPIDVDEPSRDETVAILMRSVDSYERFHGVSYTPRVVELAVDTAIRFIPERRLPDKAIDLLDVVGAWAAVRGLTEITPALVEEAAAGLSGGSVPDGADALSLATQLAERVPGQEEGAAALVRAALRNALLSTTGEARTIAIVGPAHSAKKFAAAELAAVMKRGFVKINMAEFPDSAHVTRLIGAPPGYVGFESGGMLYDVVKRNPGAVLLLHDYDRAHQAVRDMIEECIAKGVVRDATDRIAPLSSLQVVLTMDTADRRGGFGFAPSSRDETLTGVSAIDDADTLVEFGAVDRTAIMAVLFERLAALGRRVAERGVTMSLGPEDAETLMDGIVAGRDTVEAALKSFKKLVEVPVLDYIVGGSTAFSVAFDGNAIRMTENEIPELA